MGPALLLQRQRGDISLTDLKKKWKRAEETPVNEKQKATWPWSMELPCSMCSILQGDDTWKPLSLFCARYMKPTRAELWKKYLALGETLTCHSPSLIQYPKIPSHNFVPCTN